MKIYATVAIVFILFVQINSQNIEGENCTTSTGGQGVCSDYGSCLTSRREKLPPKICAYINLILIVCCPTNVSLPTTTDSKLDVEECQYPKTAITVSKTGQKAWDKCIDLADSVFPCVTSPVLDAPKFRKDTCKHTGVELILGDISGKPDEFPHLAALGYDNTEPEGIEWYCSGTLISEQWVMTTAHCLFNKHTRADVKYVRLDGEDTNLAPNPEFLFNVIERKKHPEYTGARAYNDIGLLKLDKTVKYSERMRPACLHVGNQINDDKAISSGWNAFEANKNGSNNFLKISLEKFSFEKCSELYPPTRRYPDGIRNETQMCYGSRSEAKDACLVNNGGSPLQLRNEGVYCTYTVIGITSLGKRCGAINSPDIFTRVSAYVPWIESVVWPN